MQLSRFRMMVCSRSSVRTTSGMETRNTIPSQHWNRQEALCKTLTSPVVNWLTPRSCRWSWDATPQTSGSPSKVLSMLLRTKDLTRNSLLLVHPRIKDSLGRLARFLIRLAARINKYANRYRIRSKCNKTIHHSPLSGSGPLHSTSARWVTWGRKLPSLWRRMLLTTVRRHLQMRRTSSQSSSRSWTCSIRTSLISMTPLCKTSPKPTLTLGWEVS